MIFSNLNSAIPDQSFILFSIAYFNHLFSFWKQNNFEFSNLRYYSNLPFYSGLRVGHDCGEHNESIQLGVWVALSTPSSIEMRDTNQVISLHTWQHQTTDVCVRVHLRVCLCLHVCVCVCVCGGGESVYFSKYSLMFHCLKIWEIYSFMSMKRKLLKEEVFFMRRITTPLPYQFWHKDKCLEYFIKISLPLYPL